MQYVMSLGCTVAAVWGRVGGTFTWGGLNELNLCVCVHVLIFPVSEEGNKPENS